jgi:hypothetical protein
MCLHGNSHTTTTTTTTWCKGGAGKDKKQNTPKSLILFVFSLFGLYSGSSYLN